MVLICETITPVDIVENGLGKPVDERNRVDEISPFTEVSIALNAAIVITYLYLKNLEEKLVKLQLQNQFGKKKWAESIQKREVLPIEIDFSIFQNGLYFLEI